MSIVLLGAVLLASACTGHSDVRQHSAFDGMASADLTSIAQGECEPVAKRFDARMSASLTAQQLCGGYTSYVQQFGALVKQDQPYSTKRGDLTVVRVQLHLQKSSGEFRETFDADGKVSGVYLLKAGTPLP